jgi:mannitol/fructose-specific phosphotransferase system IIA component (Ntr-type)
MLHAEVEHGVDTAVLLTLAEPLEIETPDHRPVRVVFLLVRSSEGRARLETVARVARLASYDITDELCTASTPEQVHSIIARIESLW